MLQLLIFCSFLTSIALIIQQHIKKKNHARIRFFLQNSQLFFNRQLLNFIFFTVYFVELRQLVDDWPSKPCRVPSHGGHTSETPLPPCAGEEAVCNYRTHRDICESQVQVSYNEQTQKPKKFSYHIYPTQNLYNYM